ncbi:MAG: GNAT family N-acetyltransferase [candidate division WOR-3 bacterium]|jgi:GNAT superfamily N-acetyltransferase
MRPSTEKSIIIRPLTKNDARAIGELTISFRQEIGCDAIYSPDEFVNLFDTPWLENGIGLVLERESELIAYGWVSFTSWCQQDVIHLGVFLSRQAREKHYYRPLIEELLVNGKQLAAKYNTRKLFYFSRASDHIHPPILREFGFHQHAVSMLGLCHGLDNVPLLVSDDKIKIRALKLPAEVKILLNLWAVVFDDPSNQGEPLDESVLTLETKRPDFKPEQVIIAEAAAEPVGYLLTFICKNLPYPAYEIADIGVLPQWRGKGIGRLLLITALNWIKSQGASKAIASMLSSNRAISLFWQAGFRPEPSRTYNFFIKSI